MKKQKEKQVSMMQFTNRLKVYFVISVIFTLVGIVFQFLMPQVFKITVDSVIGSEPFSMPQALLAPLTKLGGREFLRDNLYICALAVVFVALVSGVCNLLSGAAIAKFTEGFIKNLRDKLYTHVQKLPFKWHTSHQTGDIIQRCTSDVDIVRTFISRQLNELIRTIILIVTALILMFSMNVTLSLIALVFVPVVAGYSGIFFSKIRRHFKTADETEGELMVAVQENLTGVRVVRAFGRQRFEREKFDEKNNAFANCWINLGYTMGIYWGLGDLVTGLQVLCIILVGTVFAVQGKISLGEFLVFVSYNQTLAWPVRSLGRILSNMSKTGVSIERLKDILKAEPEPDESALAHPDLKGDIVFEDVSFSYDNQPILSHLSFAIKAGSTFGILGGTGSGKSTITYLLNRLYDLPPHSGKISIGGVDIHDIDRDYLRQNIGLVLQEPFLFSKTILENIAITQGDCDLHQVRHEAHIAAVDEAIMDFEQGYDTVVGERGVTLSGGQKQRVAIARTLLTGAPIMVFDDSLSAVDMQTDAKIRQSLAQNTDSATVVLISHRINTLMDCDNILVLEDGCVSEMGDHDTLLGQNGTYRRIFEMQSSAGEDLLIGEEA